MPEIKNEKLSKLWDEKLALIVEKEGLNRHQHRRQLSIDNRILKLEKEIYSIQKSILADLRQNHQ